jgi:hypothetical protein
MQIIACTFTRDNIYLQEENQLAGWLVNSTATPARAQLPPSASVQLRVRLRHASTAMPELFYVVFI